MKPRIGIVLGDPCGIGPELIAKVLSDQALRERAHVVVLGDQFIFEDGARIASVDLPIKVIKDAGQINFDESDPVLLECATITADEIKPGQALAASGKAVLKALGKALDLEKAGVIDAVMFAPLNKQAMHLSGFGFNDELHWFADRLGHNDDFCEFNVLDNLWTSRVTSHIPLKDVAGLITEDAIVSAIEMINSELKKSGVKEPRISVAALNPHAGDGGAFGTEEIDTIEPAVRRASEMGITVDGPWPPDTIFLRGRDGLCDAVVTMFHDQGQIAMKLMGFDKGITVQGGLPVPITTPAHGTAFDIVGQGIANPEATRRAFALACDMASNRQPKPA